MADLAFVATPLATFALLVAVALLGYLALALAFPERF